MQAQTPSTSSQIQAPATARPVPLPPGDLAKVSGAGPNGGWQAAAGPNGGWQAAA